MTEANQSTGQTGHFQVVLNRHSGALQDLWHDGLPAELEKIFGQSGVEATVRAVAPEKLDEAIDEAIATRPGALVVGGGDGTVTSAARRLVDQEIPLGILPLGTFNLAARDLGVPLDLTAAARALAKAPPDRIDILGIGEHLCLCIALAGFYPRMAERREEFHGRAWWIKSFQIIKDSFLLFNRSRPLNLRLKTSEGKEVATRTRFAAFIPGDYQDLFSIIPKRTKLAEGMMTVYLSKHQSLPGMIRASLAYLFGMLRMEKDLRRIHTSAVRIEEPDQTELLTRIDGEIVRLPLPLDIEVRKKALKVLKPKGKP